MTRVINLVRLAARKCLGLALQLQTKKDSFFVPAILLLVAIDS